MTNNNQQYALVTGATSGIGYELAKLLAQDGFNLVIVARTQSDLEKTASDLSIQYNVNVIPIAKDLFEPNAAFDLYHDVKSREINIHTLVNDAGQGVYGPLVETDIERQLKIIQLNITSLTTLTYLFLKDMIANDEGRILQLASIVSEVPAPLQSVYAAQKHLYFHSQKH
jgi:short-subunit dehydrogenase